MSGPGGVSARISTVAGVLTVAAVLLAVLAIVQWAGHPHAPFEPRSFAEVEAAFGDAGLQVCAGADAPDPLANQSVATRTYVLAQACPGPAALVVVDRFADVADRDATARDLTARIRPRGSGVVYTYGEFTVLIEGAGSDQVQDRLDVALRAAGAR